MNEVQLPNPIAYTPGELMTALPYFYEADVPVHIKGSPGNGKTSITEQVAALLASTKYPDFSYHCHSLAQFERVDWTGVPSVVNGHTTWNPPDIFPTEGRGFFVVDEITSAPKEMQPPLYQFLQERRVGNLRLPPGYLPISTGNLATDKAVTVKMSTALANRLAHVLLVLDVNDWTIWACKNGIIPVLVAFARFRPALFLNGFDPSQDINLTPRSMEKLSNILKTNPPKSLQAKMIAGTIGERHMAELLGYIEIWRGLPSMDSILLNPTKESVPTDPATLFAVTAGLARRATEQNFDRIMQYADRLPEDEWRTYLVKDAARRNPDIKNTTAFIAWAAANTADMG